MTETAGAVHDPRAVLASSPMTWRQGLAVATCVALTALDGFDVLSISFASPGIAAEWGIDRAALGIVLSMELFGMAVGSILLGQVADRQGRRPTAMLSLTIMALGMFGTTQASSIAVLAATRLFTGVGIGGMLATTNALVAEYSSDRRRGAAVALMAAGYPLGAVAGGSIASALLVQGDWRMVFYFGAAATALFLPLIPLLLPEPVGSLLQRRPPDVLAKVNRSLRRLGHETIGQLPPRDASAPTPTLRELFSPRLRRVTMLLTAGDLLHVLTFYFILKWVPKIVVDMGFSAASAGAVLVWANVGGLLGGVAFSVLSLRFVVRGLLIAAMLASTVLVVVFGQGQADLAGLSWAAATAGFFTNAGMVGFYAIIAASFPTAVRSGGTGFVIGIGRSGAALSPILAGFLFAAGWGLPTVAGVMALGSLLGALAIFLLPRHRGRTVTADAAVPGR